MNQRPLADFVAPPEVPSTQLHAEWHEVRRRVRRRRQLKLISALSVALVLMGVGLGVALRPTHETIDVGAAIAGASQTVWLKEGSSIVTAPQTELHVLRADAADVRLVVERGAATFDVTKNVKRRFVVEADSVEVLVVGTRFTVRREAREVGVEVERGVVEVRDGDQVLRLTAGQKWSRALAPRAAVAPTPDLAPEPLDEVQPLTDRPPEPRAVRRVTKRETPTSAGPSAVTPEVEPEPAPEVEPPPPAPVEPNAGDVFAEAMRDRAAGRSKAAVLGFQQVCERWPQSAYAPMSAFEWGRLALDALDDPRQAARAFERTLEFASSPQLVEDTLARLAEAYARYDVASCRRVQAEYLRKFPGGPHARGVSKACPP